MYSQTLHKSSESNGLSDTESSDRGEEEEDKEKEVEKEINHK